MPPSKIIIDTSFLYALYDEDSPEHLSVQEVAHLFSGQLLVPQIVLTEVTFLVRREMGSQAAVAFLMTFADSQPALVDIIVDDLRRAAQIMHRYVEADFDFVDCCIMALCERINVIQVGTLDRRDFRIFRPAHCDYLELLP